MKGLALLLLLSCGVASADTMIQLPVPDAVKAVAGAAYAHCTAAAFGAGGTVVGACQTVHSAACSGRGCQPVRYTYKYVATWDGSGNSLTLDACSVTRSHVPQVPVVTYLNGHTATDCTGTIYNPTGAVIELPSIFDPAWLAPYFYVTTDAVSGNILANSNTAGFLFKPVGISPDYGKFE